LGDVLVLLERDELEAVLMQARAAEQQAKARVLGLQSTGRRVVDSAVLQADALVLKAQAELRRTQELASKGFLSQTKLDGAQSDARVAQAQRASAVAQSAAYRGTELSQAVSQVALAHAASAAAAARFTQINIRAPADANVLIRQVEPGQIVQPGKALFSLALLGPTLLVAQVDERYLEQLRVGQSAGVVADAFPTTRFSATVQSIAPVVDAQRGAVEVKLALSAPALGFMREDMTLSVEVETARRERALVLPVAALRNEKLPDRASVLVEIDGRAQDRVVRVGIRTLTSVEIVEGLAEGDTVLVSGAVLPGRRVRTSTAKASAAP
jgi:HlyD family secretion protein